MKRILLILLVLALLLSLSACRLQKLPDPTPAPTAQPTEAPEPTPQPTPAPTAQPTPEPTPQPTPEPTAEPVPVQTGYPVGPAGYALKDPASFAARAEGHYVMVNYPVDEENDEWGPETQLELYAVGDNLYGFISEWGFAAMEFFPAEGEEGFSSTTADSMLVDVQSFSIQSNVGEHWSRGVPARLRMVLTEEGVTFTDFDHQSGDSMLIADILPFIRMDQEPGHMDAFCYRDYADALAESAPAGAGPSEELTGLWRLLGEADWAPFLEFTPDGLVQYYMKTGTDVVTLWRGSYAAAQLEDGSLDVCMILIGLGMSSQPSFYEIYCQKQADGSLNCHEGDQDFGERLLWDGAVLLPVAPADIPALGSECLPTPGSLAFSAGTYRNVWDMELVISEIGAFYYYPANDQDMEYMVMGRADEAEGGLMLYAIDQDSGEESLFAAAYYANPNCLELEFAEGGMPQPFVMEDIYAAFRNRLEGDWYQMRGETQLYNYSFSEDGSWYAYGWDSEKDAAINASGTWQPAEGGGDYRCFALFDADGGFYDYAYVYYSVADASWIMSLASSGDVYG